MSIRGIIEDDGVATPLDVRLFDKGATAEVADAYGHYITQDMTPEFATFIAIFDPEHVALMEAVVEAVEHDGKCGVCGRSELFSQGWMQPIKHNDGCAVAALAAYREERGL